MIVKKTIAGPAFASLMILGMLSACSAKPEKTPSQSAEIQEIHALVHATSLHPSLVDRADNAGPPIHVNPYPTSAGPRHHNMAGAAHARPHA
jgi:hypothetical protein